MINRPASLFVATLSLGCLAFASDHRMAPRQPNAKSPEKETSATIAGKKIRIEYSSPSARGRQVMGGVVPYGQVWRTGADGATTLITDADLTFGTLQVPKGVYTIWTLPGEKDWQLIINKQTKQWGTNYDQSQDLGRVPMKVRKLSTPAESVDIALKSTGGNKGTLEITWGDTAASADFTAK